MFDVRLLYPMRGDFAAKDERIYAAAGRVSDWAGASPGTRDHGWQVPTFEDATAMKGRLDEVPGVYVTIREAG